MFGYRGRLLGHNPVGVLLAWRSPKESPIETTARVGAKPGKLDLSTLVVLPLTEVQRTRPNQQ